jgi:hypothetical protein
MLTATATFQTANGAHLSESLAAYHPGDAETWLTALRNGPACAVVNEGEYQGTPIVARVTQPDAPALGDQSFALRLTSDGPSGTLMTDLVYVRIRDFILQISDSEVGAADPGLTTAIVQQAVLDFQAAKLIP